jgi:energy-coupling factor transporter ATP-binding protein EcfA2
MDDPSIQDFKGFANQLEWAAKQHREKYLFQILGKGKTIAGYAPGKTVTIDGKAITPMNQATAMLYSYTPHLSGNYNLWKIWRRWFSLSFPEGSVVKAAGSGKVYLIKYGAKREFKNASVLASMADPSKVILADDSQLAAYDDGNKIAFANYAIVETETKARYLLVGTKKRLIVSKAVFQKFGFNEDEVINAKAADLADYEDGQDLTAQSAHPTGILFQDPKKQLWYVEDGIKYLVPNRSFVKLYLQGRIAKAATVKQLATYKDGGVFQLRDGELVRTVSNPSVFVMENGKRRPIPSADVFETIGWQWKNVVTLPDDVLAGYPVGDPVELNKPMIVPAEPDPTEVAVETP